VWGVISDKLFCGDRIRPAILLSLCGAISIGVIGIIGEETNMKTVFLLSVFIGFTAIGWNALLMTLGTEAVGQ
jgi:sugar phosphate permease